MNWLVRIASILGTVLAVFLIDGLVTANIQDYTIRLIALAGLYVTLAVSLNLINGITGQFSVGHAGFYMVGAYTAMLLSEGFYEKQSLGPVAWLIVMLIAGATVLQY